MMTQLTGAKLQMFGQQPDSVLQVSEAHSLPVWHSLMGESVQPGSFLTQLERKQACRY